MLFAEIKLQYVATNAFFVGIPLMRIIHKLLVLLNRATYAGTVTCIMDNAWHTLVRSPVLYTRRDVRWYGHLYYGNRVTYAGTVTCIMDTSWRRLVRSLVLWKPRDCLRLCCYALVKINYRGTVCKVLVLLTFSLYKRKRLWLWRNE